MANEWMQNLLSGGGGVVIGVLIDRAFARASEHKRQQREATLWIIETMTDALREMANEFAQPSPEPPREAATQSVDR